MGHTYMWCVQMGSHGLLLDLETFFFFFFSHVVLLDRDWYNFPEGRNSRSIQAGSELIVSAVFSCKPVVTKNSLQFWKQ